MRGFITLRDFKNRLTFRDGGSGAFQRSFGGISAHYEGQWEKLKIQIGIESDRQRDERQRFNNLNGKIGDQTLNQTERFGSTAIFAFTEWHPLSILTLTGAIRQDWLVLSVSDLFLKDGNQSGMRNYSRFNPAVGFSVKASSSLFFYGNYTTGFETPTLNELSANPLQTGGFNPELQPQASENLEIGVKYRFFPKNQAELSLFHINLKNESVGYRLAATDTRTYFRNAGTGQRRGAELAVNTQISEWLNVLVNYTFSDFYYKKYEVNGADFSGKTTPATPKHVFFSELRWEHSSSVFAIVQIRAVDKMFADDANTIISKDFWTAGFRAGFSWLKTGSSF
ncbi:MAG: TonB-dependent receptor [Saprospiraceae bacterium]|nr:TonB-dependent receptor [Saprospiraceae bacterium]